MARESVRDDHPVQGVPLEDALDPCGNRLQRCRHQQPVREPAARGQSSEDLLGVRRATVHPARHEVHGVAPLGCRVLGDQVEECGCRRCHWQPLTPHDLQLLAPHHSRPDQTLHLPVHDRTGDDWWLP